MVIYIVLLLYWGYFIMFANENIIEYIKIGESNDSFKKLNKIYSRIPDGTCSGCANCCMESVNTFFIEFLNIYNYLNENPELKKALIPKIKKYYFLELVQKMHCPFLNEEKKCSIYSVRPLTCRLFGHWDKQDYLDNKMSVFKTNNNVAIFFKNQYQITLPSEVITYSIPYCNDYKIKKRLKKKQRHQLSDDIFALDIPFLMDNILTDDLIGMNLIQWFIYTLCFEDSIGDLRIKITKEYLENGESKTLNKLIPDNDASHQSV